MNKIFLAYIPVVHRGLLSVLDRLNVRVGVIGNELIREFPELAFDLRAVSPESIIKMLASQGLQACYIDQEGLRAYSGWHFILPKDVVMERIAQRYLAEESVEFVTAFIRWDKKNVASETAVPPDLEIDRTAFSRMVMAKCHETAKFSPDWWRQVGAAIVEDDRIVVATYNAHLPTDFASYVDGDIRGCFDFGERLEVCGAIHAEAAAIAWAARYGHKTAGARLYCTTFPCPMCARLIGTAGFSQVFYSEGYSISDAFEILRTFGVKLVKVLPE